MFCYKCGKELPDDAVFCSACGTTVQNAPMSQPVQAAEPKQPVPKPEKPAKKKLNKKMVVGIAIAVILVLALPMILKLLGFGHADHDYSLGSNDYYEQVEDSGNGTASAGKYAMIDLENFFGAQNQSAEEGEESFTFDVDPRDALWEYITLMQLRYKFLIDDSYEDEGAAEWVMHHEDDEDASLTIWADRAGDGTWEVICRLGALLEQTGDEVWEWPQAEESAPAPEPTPAPEPEPEPEPTPQPASKPSASDPSVIPDFLANDASGKYSMSDSSSSRKALYEAFDLRADYVVQDYVNSLVNMGYSVVYTEEDVHSGSLGGIYKAWDLRHDGVDAGALRKDSSGQIRVKLNTYESWEKCSVSVEFADGITMENYSASGSGSSSGSGGSSSSNHLDSKRPCNICNRTGDCQTCGGDGYLWSSANDKENRNCYSCRNGKCRTCNGTGWID